MPSFQGKFCRVNRELKHVGRQHDDDGYGVKTGNGTDMGLNAERSGNKMLLKNRHEKI
jgi:hypothetical protein